MSFCLVDQVCILACSVVPEAKAVHSAGDHVSTQDFAVTQKLFMVQRRLCKLSHEQCVADLVSSRDPGSIRLMEMVRAVQRMEHEQA